MQPLDLTDSHDEDGSGGENGRPFADVLEVLFRRRLLIAVCVAVALAAAALVSLGSRPMYRATSLLNLDRERPNPLDLGTGAHDASADPDAFATETQLIKNREVAERVAARRILANRKSVGDSAPVAATVDRDKVVSEALRIQKHIEVVPVRGTNLIQLSFVADDPKTAADTANAIAEAYVDWKLESKFRLMGQASKFLSSQIDEAKQALAEKEQRLVALGRQKDILAIAPQSSVTLSKLTAINQDAAAAMADRISKEARYNELLTANADALPEALFTGSIQQMRADLLKLERDYAEKLNVYKPEWPAMQSLKGQIEKSRQVYETARHEAVLKAREAAKADYQTALRREATLKEAAQRQQSEAMSLSRDAIDYNNLRIEAETQRALVDNLLKRQAEMQVLLRLQGERLSNIRIVETALPPGGPFKPSYPKNALLGLLAGLASGIGIAMMLDTLDRSIHSPEQASRSLRLPVLGVIPPARAALDPDYGYGYGYSGAAKTIVEPGQTKRPHTKGKHSVKIELLPHELPRSVVAEAYRSFRTALLLSRADGVRTLVVTSAIPLEGKSSTATNLAIVLGQLDRRILLVDSDLRRPRLHEILNVSNRVGLVSVLAAQTDPSDAIVETPIPNVFLVPAGPAAPDPSGLLSSDAMRRFVRRVTDEFENVIFDSPPILASADAVLLGNLTDGAVLCIQADRTPRERIVRARDELLRGRVHVLGLLLNSLRDESRRGASRGSYAPSEKDAREREQPPSPKAVTAGG